MDHPADHDDEPGVTGRRTAVSLRMVSLGPQRTRVATSVAAFVALLAVVTAIPVSRAQPDVDPLPGLIIPLGDRGVVAAVMTDDGGVAVEVALPEASEPSEPTDGASPSWSSPWAAAPGSDGVLWVSDAGSGTISRVDPDTWTVLDTPITDAAGSAGTDDEADKGGGSARPRASGFRPRGLAVDPDGRLFVVEAEVGRVLRFPLVDGATATEPDLIIADPDDPSTEAPLIDPVAVLVDVDGSLLVSDRGDDDVERFDPDTGEHLETVATLEPGDAPAGMALDDDGRVLVVLAGRAAVVSIDPETGAGVDEPLVDDLVRPVGVALDGDGTLWVSDPWTGRVTAHDPDTGEATGVEVDLPDGGGPRLLTTRTAESPVGDADKPPTRLTRRHRRAGRARLRAPNPSRGRGPSLRRPSRSTRRSRSPSGPTSGSTTWVIQPRGSTSPATRAKPTTTSTMRS